MLDLLTAVLSDQDSVRKCHSSGLHQPPKGTRSLVAHREANLILAPVKLYLPALSVVYIPGLANWQVYILHYQHLDSGKLPVHLEVFQDLLWVGVPGLDLLASRFKG